jgi:TRAP-type mannitol/chloroaromatic compound transport system permease small subunit
MKKAVTGLVRFIDGLNSILGKAVSWLALLLVCFVSFDVFARYLFHKSFTIMQELEWHFFSLLFLLGAGYTLAQNAHVRVDIFYQRLSKKGRALIDLIGCVVFLFTGVLLVIKTSLPFVQASWQIHEGSPDPSGIKAWYWLKTVVPVSFVLLGLQGVSMFFKSLFVLLGLKMEPT